MDENKKITLEEAKVNIDLLKEFNKVYIWSRQWGAYWRQNGKGYTYETSEAGVYNIQEAYQAINHCGPEKGIEFHAFQPEMVGFMKGKEATLSFDFLNRMEHEIRINEHQKGDWRQWSPTKIEAISELNHHISKLSLALYKDETMNVAEYSADCGNLAMMIFHHFVPKEIKECLIHYFEEEDVKFSKISSKKTNSPKIICLCGSTRFVDLFNEYRKIFTYRGYIVLSIEIITTQSKSEDPQFVNPELKKMLDQLHLRKIDLADEVFIINKNGYIGESTHNEIDYCIKNHKSIKYLEECTKEG